MNISLITISHKPPAWIKAGYEEYAKRLPPAYSLKLIEIPAEKRTANADLVRIKEREGQKLLNKIKPQHLVIALEVKGQSWSTPDLSNQLKKWQQGGRDVVMLIGGPEGLSESCLTRADIMWSLSPLTFPHLFVRIMVAEQIYRAWSIIEGHPYHR